MSSAQSPCTDPSLAVVMAEAGIYRYGIARALPVDENHTRAYTRFISSGHHGSMTYLERHQQLRTDPRTLLTGATSVISCAIPYYTSAPRPRLSIARYALGADYHTVVRDRLERVAEYIRRIHGGLTRVCVDTAPLPERYWAVRAGIGFIGRNRQLIIPGAGSYFFLGEILVTAQLPPSQPCTDSCGNCGRCVRACPTGALTSHSFDARRCLSYLTIEHRGPISPDIDLHNTFYGCDRCAEACPHNSAPPSATIPDFFPNPVIARLTAADILSMDHDLYARTFRGSPMKRAKLDGLIRNAAKILP